MIALTFDDGPAKSTSRIVDLLDTYNSQATFCVVGNRIADNAEILKETIAGGNEIAIHTWSHQNLSKLSEEEVRSEISKAADALEKYTGYTSSLLRPPYGNTNATVEQVCRDEDLAIIKWSVDTEDWKTKDANSTFEWIKTHAEDGAIILCHDIHSQTADAMELAIPWLIEQGYQIVTVSDMFEANGRSLQPGSIYRHL